MVPIAIGIRFLVFCNQFMEPLISQISRCFLDALFCFVSIFYSVKFFYQHFDPVFLSKISDELLVPIALLASQLKITMGHAKFIAGLLTQFAKNDRVNSAAYGQQQFIF